MADQSVRGRIVPPGQIKPRVGPNHRAAIEKIGARLTPFGVTAECFDEAATLALGYTDPMVFKLLRPFEADKEDSRIEALLLIGREEHFYPVVDKAELPAFLRFLDFLRTRAGQERVSQIHRQERLRRRGQGIFTAEEVAWLDMFEVQRIEYSNSVAEIRRRSEAVIADLELQIRDAKAARDRWLREEAVAPTAGGALHTAAADGAACGGVEPIPPVDASHQYPTRGASRDFGRT